MSPRSPRLALTLRHALSLGLVAALVVACGGGGGGGGGSSTTGGGGPAANVAFTGFTFRVGNGPATATPPTENLSQVPPSLGAPLDITLIFNFDGVPQGPFSQASLPVFTTPADVTPDAGASAGTPVISAKGAYVLVGNTVEFRPFVPTAPLQVALSAPADAVPGLLPSSTYTMKVVTTPGLKLPNLKGAGGTVKFDTTSLPAGYFTGGGSTGLGPRVVATVPADGATGFFPGPYSNFAPGASLPSFPAGDESFTLTFDQVLAPTSDNLDGHDWDGDGYVDPNLFLRSQATRLLVAQTVPGASSIGNANAFPALSGLTANQSVPAGGQSIFLHDSQGPGALPGGDPALSSTPSCIEPSRDPDLVYVVLRVDGGTDRLSVADHVLGDPSHADLAGASLDTGLGDLTGLTQLLSGRLIAYDTATRRLYELMPKVTRVRPVGQPTLTSLTIGDGVNGFRSDVFPAGIDVIDMAQSPTGDLYALVSETGNTFPKLMHLAPIDPDLNGSFEAGEGLPVGSPVLSLNDHYGAIAFIDATTLYALNRGTDAIDTLDLAAGFTGTVVNGVAAYGVPLAGLPGGLSPALDLAVGFMDIDVQVSVISNSTSGAVVQLKRRGVLPIGARLDVMERYALSSATGVSLANEDASAPKSVLGADRVLTVTTSDPINTVGACTVVDPDNRVNDVMDEGFDDTTFEDTTATGLSPLAEWAAPIAGGGTSSHLRASVGANGDTSLGDFLPQPNADFDPTKAYPEGGDDTNAADFRFVFFDTDAQNFPMANGETPNVTQNLTVFGGNFQFHDFIIPAGVWVHATGTHPLSISATGKVEIAGVLDLSGTPGQDDDTFNSGFVPVPGGSGGAGGGRGGDGQPTVYPPNVIQNVANVFVTPYATPETGEDGWGPVVSATGGYVLGQVGGRGGLSSLGYEIDPNNPPYPNVKDSGKNSEFSRSPGGGGGSFFFHGIPSHYGTGSYRVQSSSSWGNFTLCPDNDHIQHALYGMDELQYCYGAPPNPLQCVYMQGTPSNPQRFQPSAMGGAPVFSDGNPDNDYFGGNGELQVLIGGQGGGGGGSRIDSMKAVLWAGNPLGLPPNPLPPSGAGPPCYPNLFIGFYAAPSGFDAKGGGAGGGGGSVLIRSFGDIHITKTGHINCSGADGAGGETIGSSNYSGGGGGGSGGAIILQAAGDIVIEADSNHRMPGFTDKNGADGASLDVSGGMGDDAATRDDDIPSQKPAPVGEFSRSDGGQGGFGLIQLQEGSGDGTPTVEQGAFLFARQRAVTKRYDANKSNVFSKLNEIQKQQEHPDWASASPPPDILRYIDIQYYRGFFYDASPDVPISAWYVLNGSYPPIIKVTDPNDIGQFQLDTPTIPYFGKRVVREPQPERILKTYNGYDANFKEIPVGLAVLPGTPYQPTDDIPLNIWLKEPDGTPPTEIVDGVEQCSPSNIIDRLPVVSPTKTPPEFGTVSRGTSVWLDFNGVAVRVRDASGIAPPLFSAGINGTYNALNGTPPPGLDGDVVTGNAVPGVPAHFVLNTGFPPFDPGLCGNGSPPDPQFNDIKVDAPEFAIDNALTDNATVALLFQGAFPIRSGSHVPDPDTLTAWVSDLRALSGYPLVRFQVVFDVSKDHDLYPFGANSLRPAVDRVRMRVRY